MELCYRFARITDLFTGFVDKKTVVRRPYQIFLTMNLTKKKSNAEKGNFDNAVEVVFENGALSPLSANNFSGGILGGAQSTFGTASSPTRTTQTIVASATLLDLDRASTTGRDPYGILYRVASGTVQP